jgi:hypothetical protein
MSLDGLGFKWKASPKVPELIGISKHKHRLWDQAGRPRDEHELFLDKKEAKRLLENSNEKSYNTVKGVFVILAISFVPE